MKSNPDIGQWLQQTPPPVPPPELLATLERQIEVPRPRSTAPAAQMLGAVLGQWLARCWKPVTGIGGVAALIIMAVMFGDGGGRSIAAAYENLGRVKSVRVLHYERSGPSHAVMRDRSKPTNASPNFSTSMHPANPLVVEEILFRVSPDGVSEMVAIRETETVWSKGGWELRVNHVTGERRFGLVSTPLDIGRLANPVRVASDYTFDPVPLTLARETAPAGLESCWLGERQHPGMSINGWPAANVVTRVWLDETTQLARRIEWVSEDFAEVSAPWISQAYEFYDFGEPLADAPFAIEVTEADVAQIGITLDELSKLSPRAVSIHLTGEAGVVVRGTVKNSAGTRNVSGPLPLAFVIDPVGETSLDLRLADGQRHSFGIAANGMNLATWTSRLIASIGPTGEFSAQSSD